MPRMPVALTTPLPSFPTLPVAANSADAVQTAADPVNLNSIAFGRAPRLLVVAINTHATTPYTVTLTSAPINGRTGDISNYSIDPGEVVPFFVPRSGWRQSDGTLWLQASNAAVKFVAIQL